MGKSYRESDLESMNPSEARGIIRRGEWKADTIKICIGYAKFNLVVLPQELAYEFLLFSERNPASAFVSEATDPGDPYLKLLAQNGDLRTDLPKYRVFKDGRLVDEPTDIKKYWRNDLVGFLIGAAPNLLSCLIDANVQHRMFGGYTSTIPTIPAGRFGCSHLVVGIMFKSTKDVVRSIQISSRLPVAHFAPLHIGDATGIGIMDIYKPDIFANTSSISPLEPGETPVFWGNGITPQRAAMEAKIPFMITHKPAHHFISDQRVEELATF